MSALIYGFVCFFLLSLIVITSIATILSRHARECRYSIKMPCYSDWQCASSSGTTPVYSASGPFGRYFAQCLGSNRGICGSASAQLSSSASQGCDPLDYDAGTNAAFSGYAPYTGLTGPSNTFNTIYNFSGSPDDDITRNLCSKVPATLLTS
jgi:hypothetical protein